METKVGFMKKLASSLNQKEAGYLWICGCGKTTTSASKLNEPFNVPCAAKNGSNKRKRG